MVEAGVFPPDSRAQLISGEIVEMSPQRPRHATAVRLVQEALRHAFGEGNDVRSQLPIAIDPDSEPEPDVFVVPGGPRDYISDHPKRVLLVVEVSDQTLRFDRVRKLPMYARGGIPEYWIVNLTENVLEVYREPAGELFNSKQTLGPGEAVEPLAAPGARIQVSDLLP